MIPYNDAVIYLTEKFSGHYDKAGEIYILHCITVATRAVKIAHKYHITDKNDIDTIFLAGLFHDTIEDLGFTEKDIENYTKSKEVAHIVKLLTHEKNVSYDEYINQVKSDKFAIIIKIADAWHNSEVSRFHTDEEQIKHIPKCLKYLELVHDLMNFKKFVDNF